MEKLLDIMEEDDDVQNVWHNWEEEKVVVPQQLFHSVVINLT